MLYLVLAVCCSLAIGMIFKHTARQGTNRPALLAINYAAATVMAVALVALDAQRSPGPLTPTPALLGLGAGTGALFIAGFFVYALATHVAGMALAIGVMRVSVVIPFLASWIIWSEVPTPAQGLGLVLAAVAFFLIARRPQATAAPDTEAGAGKALLVLVLLFCAGGAVDVSLKTFDEVFSAQNSRASFLLMVFGVALVIGLGFVVARRMREGVWPSRATVGWGVLLGLANYGSVEFFLRAIRALSGPFVFPANNIALVIGGALLGVYVWGERLAPVNWLGLALAAGALVLLNL